MARVVCSIENASSLINGVRFTDDGKGNLISDEITEAQADQFARTKGFIKAPPRKATRAEAEAARQKADQMLREAEAGEDDAEEDDAEEEGVRTPAPVPAAPSEA
jgi:hypothetical protein